MFGERLRELRTEHEYTQDTLGEKFGVSPKTIGSWERGTREPPMDVISKMASLFDVSTDYLLGLSANRQPLSKNSDDLTENQKLVAYSIDPSISAEERDAIIKMVEAAKAFKKRI